MIERGHLNIGLVASVAIGILLAWVVIRLITAREATAIARAGSSSKAPIGFTGSRQEPPETEPDAE